MVKLALDIVLVIYPRTLGRQLLYTYAKMWESRVTKNHKGLSLFSIAGKVYRYCCCYCLAFVLPVQQAVDSRNATASSGEGRMVIRVWE